MHLLPHSPLVKNDKIKLFLIILQETEDFPESDRQGFSQTKLYFGNFCSSLNFNANFSLQLKLSDPLRAS